MIKIPPVDGCLQPVVLGKDIGNFKIDLTAKNAKACDSIKSPSILKSSINFRLISFDRFSFILLIKTLFFLPPPQINILFILFLDFFKKKDNSSLRILAVNSVSVATPSSRFNPLVKEISKSFVSKDNLFFNLLFLYSS